MFLRNMNLNLCVFVSLDLFGTLVPPLCLTGTLSHHHTLPSGRNKYMLPEIEEVDDISIVVQLSGTEQLDTVGSDLLTECQSFPSGP